MDTKNMIENFWKAVVSQNAQELLGYFAEDAHVNWHNTNEKFTVSEYIRANCEYPNAWGDEIERVEEIGNLIITVVRVFTLDGELSFHATSFIKIVDGKIAQLDEYWGDDGAVPQWRLDKNIGTLIKNKIN